MLKRRPNSRGMAITKREKTVRIDPLTNQFKPHPAFPGWVDVPLDAPLEAGDVWVWISDGPCTHYPEAVIPDKGVPLRIGIGDIQRNCFNYPRWLAYRRSGPRIFKGHVHFGKPLPLP